MKKLLFISHSSRETGGAESEFEKLLSYFSSFNNKYEVYCLLPEGKGVNKYSQYCKKYGIISDGVFPSFLVNIRDYIIYLVKGYKQIREVKKFLPTSNFDLIVLNVSVLIIPLIYLKFKKQKIIVFIREFIKPDLCRKFVYKILAYSSNYFFSVSNMLKNDFIKITNNENISTLYSAIEENQIIENLTKIKIPGNVDKKYIDALFSSKYKILNIGPVCKLKNQVIIIEALKLFKVHGENVPCFFSIGDFKSSTKYIKMLKGKINEYELNDNCFFIGNLDKQLKNSLIDKVDILIISSLSEGMPLVMVEAMEFGKPLIATNVGGIPEIIINSYNGILIEPTALELYKAIKTLIADEILRNDIIKNARNFAKQYFNLKKNLFVIEKISNQIIDN